MTIDIVCPNHY